MTMSLEYRRDQLRESVDSDCPVLADGPTLVGHPSEVRHGA
jgi:hypothetical protein